MTDTENKALKAWTASFVRRWHTHPLLADTGDTNSGHQQRSTLLLLSFWPDSSREAIIDCIIHDQGEIDSGDIARPVKRRFPGVRGILKAIERTSMEEQGFGVPDISDEELERREWVDLLDSFLWMLRHRPHLRHRPEWHDQLELLSSGASKLGVAPEFLSIVLASLEYMVDSQD